MAVQERSLGPLYFATTPTRVMTCPPTLVGLVEQAYPFRRGKGLMFPGRLYQGVTIGLWFKPWKRNDEQGDDCWFDPKWLDIEPDEISQWESDAETPQGS